MHDLVDLVAYNEIGNIYSKCKPQPKFISKLSRPGLLFNEKN